VTETTDVQLVRGGAKDRYVVRRRFDAAVSHLDGAKFQLAQSEVGPCEYDYAFGKGIARILRLLGRLQKEMMDLRRTAYTAPPSRVEVEERADRGAGSGQDQQAPRAERVEQRAEV